MFYGDEGSSAVISCLEAFSTWTVQAGSTGLDQTKGTAICGVSGI